MQTFMLREAGRKISASGLPERIGQLKEKAPEPKAKV